MSSTTQSQDQGPPSSASLVVFEDYLGTSSIAPFASATALTPAFLDEVLGFYDQLAIQVVVDDVSVGAPPAALTVQIAHSADGLHYVYKNAAPEVSTPAQLNLGAPTYMEFGYDAGTYPSLGLVRLAVVLTGALGPVNARARITVTANNLDEHAFTQAVVTDMNPQAATSGQAAGGLGSRSPSGATPAGNGPWPPTSGPFAGPGPTTGGNPVEGQVKLTRTPPHEHRRRKGT
jgi:hypothetical protein